MIFAHCARPFYAFIFVKRWPRLEESSQRSCDDRIRDEYAAAHSFFFCAVSERAAENVAFGRATARDGLWHPQEIGLFN
jgi:hypothetical protein